MEWMCWCQGRVELLGVNTLDVEDLCGVDGALQLVDACSEVCVGVGRFACGGGRICPDTAGDVEGVKAEAEVGFVDRGNDAPCCLPGIDEGAPAEVLVREADGRAFFKAQLCHFEHISYEEGFVSTNAFGEEIAGDLDDVRAQDVGHLEPDFELLNAFGVFDAVDEALVMHEGPESNDREAAVSAQQFDVRGGGEKVRWFGTATDLGFGEVFDVFVEDLDACDARFGCFVESVGEAMDPWTAESNGGNCESVSHVCCC